MLTSVGIPVATLTPADFEAFPELITPQRVRARKSNKKRKRRRYGRKNAKSKEKGQLTQQNAKKLKNRKKRSNKFRLRTQKELESLPADRVGNAGLPTWSLHAGYCDPLTYNLNQEITEFYIFVGVDLDSKNTLQLDTEVGKQIFVSTILLALNERGYTSARFSIHASTYEEKITLLQSGKISQNSLFFPYTLVMGVDRKSKAIPSVHDVITLVKSRLQILLKVDSRGAAPIFYVKQFLRPEEARVEGRKDRFHTRRPTFSTGTYLSPYDLYPVTGRYDFQ